MEMVNAFGAATNDDESLMEKFNEQGPCLKDCEVKAKELNIPAAKLLALGQIELMYELLSCEMAKKIEDPTRFNEYDASLFNVNPPYATVLTRRALVEACLNFVPVDDWDGFKDFYHAVFDPETMDGYAAAQILKSLAPLWGKLDQAGRDSFVKDVKAHSRRSGPYQFVETLQVLSRRYEALPNSDGHSVYNERWAYKGLSTLQEVEMAEALAKVLPVLGAVEKDKKTKICNIWREDKDKFHPAQQPGELRKLLRKHQLIQLGKVIPNS